jgi:hypothetical protein
MPVERTLYDVNTKVRGPHRDGGCGHSGTRDADSRPKTHTGRREPLLTPHLKA